MARSQRQPTQSPVWPLRASPTSQEPGVSVPANMARGLHPRPGGGLGHPDRGGLRPHSRGSDVWAWGLHLAPPRSLRFSQVGPCSEGLRQFRGPRPHSSERLLSLWVGGAGKHSASVLWVGGEDLTWWEVFRLFLSAELGTAAAIRGSRPSRMRGRFRGLRSWCPPVLLC